MSIGDIERLDEEGRELEINEKTGLPLTKAELVDIVSQAGKEAADRAMKAMGYVVTVRDGWLVNLFQDGTVERIEPIDKGNRLDKDSKPGSDAR